MRLLGLALTMGCVAGYGDPCDHTDACIVGARGYDGLAKRIIASDRSCANFAMRAVSTCVHTRGGRPDVAKIVAECVGNVDPQCYKHQAPVVAFIVASNVVGAIVWITMATSLLTYAREVRAKNA